MNSWRGWQSRQAARYEDQLIVAPHDWRRTGKGLSVPKRCKQASLQGALRLQGTASGARPHGLRCRPTISRSCQSMIVVRCPGAMGAAGDVGEDPSLSGHCLLGRCFCAPGGVAEAPAALVYDRRSERRIRWTAFGSTMRPSPYRTRCTRVYSSRRSGAS
jgi:hypothetical protein